MCAGVSPKREIEYSRPGFPPSARGTSLRGQCRRQGCAVSEVRSETSAVLVGLRVSMPLVSTR